MNQKLMDMKKESTWNFWKGKIYLFKYKTFVGVINSRLNIEISDTRKPYKGIYPEHTAQTKSALIANTDHTVKWMKSKKEPVLTLFQEY